MARPKSTRAYCVLGVLGTSYAIRFTEVCVPRSLCLYLLLLGYLPLLYLQPGIMSCSSSILLTLLPPPLTHQPVDWLHLQGFSLHPHNCCVLLPGCYISKPTILYSGVSFPLPGTQGDFYYCFFMAWLCLVEDRVSCNPRWPQIAV